MAQVSDARTTHPRDVQKTKVRLLAAARQEFAESGMAGARIDRIAERAGSNKRLLYVYFGNKEEVFGAVVTDCVSEFNAAVPFVTDDLASYAGRVFDYLAAEPIVRRVLAWRDVEGARPTPIEIDLYRRKFVAIAAAQASGDIDASLDPVDLLAVVEAVISSWLGATVGLRGAADRDSAARRAEHRRAVVVSVRRIVRPDH